MARSEAPASAKAAGNGYPLHLQPPRQSSTLLNFSATPRQAIKPFTVDDARAYWKDAHEERAGSEWYAGSVVRSFHKFWARRVRGTVGRPSRWSRGAVVGQQHLLCSHRPAPDSDNDEQPSRFWVVSCKACRTSSLSCSGAEKLVGAGTTRPSPGYSAMLHDAIPRNAGRVLKRHNMAT